MKIRIVGKSLKGKNERKNDEINEEGRRTMRNIDIKTRVSMRRDESLKIEANS